MDPKRRRQMKKAALGRLRVVGGPPLKIYYCTENNLNWYGSRCGPHHPAILNYLLEKKRKEIKNIYICYFQKKKKKFNCTLVYGITPIFVWRHRS